MIINRGVTLDPDVYTIADLKEAGSKKMEKSHRGMYRFCTTIDTEDIAEGNSD